MLTKYDDSNPANQIEINSRFVWSHPAHMIATFFGAGLPSKAPGTYGSLAGALVFIVLSPSVPTFCWIVLALALFVAGVWASDKVARDLGVNDHKSVVVDEVVGIWLLFAFLPQGTLWWIAGFAAFRFFDIVKLPPVDIIDEKLKNGVGVMADDVVAAFYAWVVVSLLGWLFG